MRGRFVIESFAQRENNCVLVVLVKAALLQYGISRVFRRRSFGDYLVIQLRNGHVLTIHPREISRLSRRARIRFRRARSHTDRVALQRVREFVYLCFTVMVKNITSFGFNGKTFTEAAAIRLLTKEGMNTQHIHELLGLRRKKPAAHALSLADLRRLRRKKSVLLYSDRHIVLASQGWYDNYGKAEKLGPGIPSLERRRARGWFELRPS